jgi:hypothetical protein
MSCNNPTKCNCKCKPKRSYLFEINDPDPADFKSKCCVSYKIEFAKQCKRCPLKQIENQEDRKKAMYECMERNNGTIKYTNPNGKELEIEYSACL